MDTLGFIGGGRMAEALIKGITAAGITAAGNTHVSEPLAARRQELANRFNVRVHEAAGPVLEACGTIVLAVKPQVMEAVLHELNQHLTENHLIISIAAGIATDFLHQHTSASGCRIVRVMPNTPALVQEGVAAISAGPGATGDDLQTALALFSAVGSAMVVNESLMDAVTGLSGSGPAYVYAFLDALTMAGIQCGLPRDAAEKLAMGTIKGAIALAETSGSHPAELTAMVTSPGGTTIAGLHVLEQRGFKGIVMDAVAAATKRSRELGQ